MSYATRQDLATRLGDELVEITDSAGSGSPDENAIALALFDACAEIDGYLGGRYPLPLANVPPNLTRLAVDIVRFRLWNDRASDEVRKRYDDAISYLRMLAAGTVTLAPPTTGEPAVANSGFGYCSGAVVMSDETLGAL